MMRVLLLGGNGFIGSNLSEALVKAGYEVSVFDRPGQKRIADPDIERQINWFTGDFLNPVDVFQALDGTDIVFHLVSSTLPQSSNENLAYDVETNVVPSIHLIEGARKAGVKKIIFLSSGGTVYGIPKQTPIPEDHPTDPICAYGISKLSVEKYLALAKHIHGLEYVVLRLANPYGRYQNPKGNQGAISVFLHKVIMGEVIDIWGDGQVIRDYIYIDDVVEAMLSVIEYGGNETIFNLGTGLGVSLMDIIHEIESMVENTVKYRFLEARSLDVPVNILDVSRIKNEIQWEAKTTLKEGLRMLYEDNRVKK